MNKANISSGHIKIFLVYLQTINSMGNLWKGPLIHSATNSLNIFNMKTNGFGIVCIFPELNNPVVNILFAMILPILFSILVLFLISGLYIFRNIGAKYNSREIEKVKKPQEKDLLLPRQKSRS